MSGADNAVQPSASGASARIPCDHRVVQAHRRPTDSRRPSHGAPADFPEPQETNRELCRVQQALVSVGQLVVAPGDVSIGLVQEHA
jgi:hypothetical protein